MPILQVIGHLKLLQRQVDALHGTRVTVTRTGSSPPKPQSELLLSQDPTFYDRLWREHLRAAYERDQARRTP